MTAHWIAPRRTTRYYSPLWNLDRLFGDLSLVDRPASAVAKPAFAPAVNIEETDRELRLSAELPGLEEEDFEVTTEGDVLTIKGEKRFESTSEERRCKRIERSQGSFERTFRVAWEIEPDSVTAVYRNGVLDLVIPKPEQDQPQARTIPVTTS